LPRIPKQSPIQSQHFTWRLIQRDGVYYADGRGGRDNLGKHSLGTRDRHQAQENLRRLDRQLAVERGLAERESTSLSEGISIARGWGLYMENRGLSPELGGVCRNSLKRYRAVRDKHAAYCETTGIRTWDRVDRNSVIQYGSWLTRKHDSAPATVLLELNTICSVGKWLVEQQQIPSTCRFSLGLPKIETSDTYCYRREEVAAMVEHCRSDRGFDWLANIIVALTTTGVRIGELAAIRWTDVDMAANVLNLTDERYSQRRRQLGNARLIKGKRGRTIPMNTGIRTVLERMHRSADGLVFHGPRGGRLKPDVVRTALIRDVIKPLTLRFPTAPGENGFEHGRVHSFRHYFVSESFRLGVPEPRIMEWVGHRDSRIVARYRHLRDDDGQHAMQQLDFLEMEKGADGPCSSGS
jgi:integrase